MLRQQSVERMDALRETLRVIETVDADDQLGAVEAVAQALYFGVLEGPLGAGGEFARVDADRVRRQPAEAAMRAEGEARAGKVHVGAQELGDIVAVAVGLE